MAEWRGRNVGIIFQFFQLLPYLFSRQRYERGISPQREQSR
jgi:predicted ABC-type transport system involved in lysophospholipase L1 biosynthesis ATPase subunit